MHPRHLWHLWETKEDTLSGSCRTKGTGFAPGGGGDNANFGGATQARDANEKPGDRHEQCTAGRWADGFSCGAYEQRPAEHTGNFLHSASGALAYKA
jgi:hypothetical protein|mmetsp:Transcript_22019/g.37283  ORF Transcript_22019/g.37283 Transcript_22019/m.37283 type:complete len:97 (-) Transcript_22019:517-807(-)